MQFNARRSAKRTKQESLNEYELAPNLQLYTVPPSENISLQEFEDLAIERVKVLKAVETLGIRHARGTKEYRDAMKSELGKYNITKLKGGEGRRKDHISHFILRLAYCKTEDLRRWFIAQELDLFRYRFLHLTSEQIQEFLRHNNLSYIPISKDEKSELLDKLKDSRHNMSEGDVEASDYYKVPFTDALELVRGTKVFIKRGYAYVPHAELVVIMQSVFRSELSHALVVTSRLLPNISEEERLVPMLSNLSRQYLGQDYSNKKASTGQVTADMLDSLAKSSFPLCMQHLHSAIRLHHHLKHGGRMQYGLFLKGIGLSLEEALKFWKSEFTRIMDGDKFDKQYAYTVRHNYGKEGKRADYTPYSCVKIITSNTPAVGDHHGCPFRHSDADGLRRELQSLNISSDGVSEVCDLVKQGHYQLACGRLFELKNNTDVRFVPQHPNQYFEESRKLLAGDRPETAAATGRSYGGATIVPVESSVRVVNIASSSGCSIRSDATAAEHNDFNDDDDTYASMPLGDATDADDMIDDGMDQLLMDSVINS